MENDKCFQRRKPNPTLNRADDLLLAAAHASLNDALHLEAAGHSQDGCRSESKWSTLRVGREGDAVALRISVRKRRRHVRRDCLHCLLRSTWKMRSSTGK